MRILVDELPNCCGNCGFCCKDDLGYWCQAREVVYIADETLGEKRLHSCPLQSLADHDKQVRKEVCEEIKEIIESDAVKYLDFDRDEFALDYQEFKDILNEIEQGE